MKKIKYVKIIFNMVNIQTCAILYFKGLLVQGNTCFSDERGCLKLTFR